MSWKIHQYCTIVTKLDNHAANHAKITVNIH